MKTHTNTLLASLTAAGLFVGSASAGITASWGGLQAISSNDDIVNPGNVIEALNFGNDSTNVNVTTSAGTITFSDVGSGGFSSDNFFVDDNTDDGAATVSGDNSSDFHRVLDSFHDNGPVSYTFTGLAPGSYQVQLFSSDDRGNRPIQYQIITDFGGENETIHADTGSLSLGGVFRSGYAIADVQLTSGTSEFTIYEALGGASPLNAAVLTLVPEFSSLTLGDPVLTVLDYDQAEATSFLGGEDASTVTLYWGTVDQGEVQTGWDGSASLGAQTAGGAIPDPPALMVSLTQATTYFCRFYAESATSATTVWSRAATFTTPNALQLTTPATTFVAYNEADVAVTSNRDTDTTQLYWGESDPGATATGWDHGPVNLGPQVAGTLPVETLAGLAENTTYFFRFYGEISSPGASTAWSEAGSFTTPNALELTNPEATSISFNQADLTVTSNFDTTGMDLYWGTSDPGATTTGWDNGPVNLGAQSAGTIPAETLGGLTENTEYFFRFTATSSSPVASTAFSDAGSFTTPLENPIASWGGLQAISSNDDIVNPGNVIEALNFGSDGTNVSVTTSAGTITFSDVGSGGFYNDSFFVDDNTDDGAATVSGDNSSDFHRVLDSFHDNGPVSYTFTGLAPGDYQVQLFSSDDRGNRTTQYQIITDFGGENETIHADTGSLSLGGVFRSGYAIADVHLTSGMSEFTIHEALGGASPLNAAVLTSVSAPTDPFGQWAAGPWSGVLTDDSPALDVDQGGLDTGIEWIVGGDPTDPSDDAGNAPTFSEDTTDFIFTYNRRDAAEADANTDIKVVYGSDLTGWNEAVHGTDGVEITPTDDSPFDIVEVKIPKSLAVGGKLFAHLEVTVTP